MSASDLDFIRDRENDWDERWDRYEKARKGLFRGLKGIKTARGAAGKINAIVRLQAAISDQDPDLEVAFRGPDDEDETWARGSYHIIHEGGDFEWAYKFSEALFAEGLYDSNTWHAEPGWSFSIVVS